MSYKNYSSFVLLQEVKLALDENPIFRTLKNNKKVAIDPESGEIKSNIGQLPTFNDFKKSFDEEQSINEYKMIVKYAKTHLVKALDNLKAPKGLPKGCTKVVITGGSAKELANKINNDKVKILHLVPYIFQNGSYREKPDLKNNKEDKVIYTSKRVKINNKLYMVELVTKRRYKGDTVFYCIGKADIIGDSKKYVYELVDIKLSLAV